MSGRASGRGAVSKNSLMLGALLAAFFVWQIGGGAVRMMAGSAMIALSIALLRRRRINRYVLVFFALAFQKGFQRVCTGTAAYQAVTYLDEVFEAFAILHMICIVRREGWKLPRPVFRMIQAFCVYMMLCTLSTAAHPYASPFVALLDAFMCMKFVVFFLYGRLLCDTGRLRPDEVFAAMNPLCACAAVMLFLLSMHDLLFAPFFEKFDFRYFMDSIQLCFQHPTYLAAVSFFLMALLMMNMAYDRRNLIYIALLGVVALLTLRTKAIVAMAVSSVVYLLLVRRRRRLGGFVLAASGAGALYLSKDQIARHFTPGTQTPIRLKLIQDGIKIACKHFPLGAGFASFGTTIAYDFHSSYYALLGYTGARYRNQPVADGFWHGILAESGWLGTAAFALFVLLLCAQGLARARKAPYRGWCMLTIVSYCAISSIAESAFFNPAVAVLFLIYGMASAETERSGGENAPPKGKSPG